MADLHVSQGYALAVVAGNTASVSQGYVLGIVNEPALQLDISNANVDAVVVNEQTLSVSQSYVLAIVRGRVADPKVRLWTFTLDNHDYVVIRLGESETYIYDTLSKQWYVWGSGNTSVWKAHTGSNWLAGYAHANDYGSNIVVGDDVNGALYFLDPDSSLDDHNEDGDETPVPFQRVVQGQIKVKGYDVFPCYGVHLMGSIGKIEEVDDTTVGLETSDDQGVNYTNRGTVDIPEAEYSTRVHWRSLGSIKLPGRLFKLTDYGVLKRIDSLDMEDGS